MLASTTGRMADLVVKSGHLFAASSLFRGGGPAKRGRGAIEIQGGSVVTKNIALGNSSGAIAGCTVVGSKAPPSRWRDYFLSGLNYLEVEKDPPPARPN